MNGEIVAAALAMGGLAALGPLGWILLLGLIGIGIMSYIKKPKSK